MCMDLEGGVAGGAADLQALTVVFTPLSNFLKNVKCVEKNEILVEQQPPQGDVACDHAGRVINKFSH